MTKKVKASQFSTEKEAAIRARILRFMEQAGESRSSLAEKIKVDSSQMTRWLNHEGKLTRNAVVQIAKGINKSPDELTGETSTIIAAANTDSEKRIRALEDEVMQAKRALLDCELRNVQLQKELLKSGRTPSA